MNRSELLKSSVIKLQHDVLDMRHWSLFVEQIRNKQPFTFIGRHWRKDGSVFRLKSISVLFGMTSVSYLSQLREIGLLNRRAGYIHFRKQLGYAQRYTQGFTLSLIDLDHFKGINDAYGHLVEDQVLKHFVSLINDSD